MRTAWRGKRERARGARVSSGGRKKRRQPAKKSAQAVAPAKTARLAARGRRASRHHPTHCRPACSTVAPADGLAQGGRRLRAHGAPGAAANTRGAARRGAAPTSPTAPPPSPARRAPPWTTSGPAPPAGAPPRCRVRRRDSCWPLSGIRRDSLTREQPPAKKGGRRAARVRALAPLGTELAHSARALAIKHRPEALEAPRKPPTRGAGGGKGALRFWRTCSSHFADVQASKPTATCTTRPAALAAPGRCLGSQSSQRA